MVKIAHLTDLHLTSPHLRDLLSEPTFKRFSGYLNWRLRRRRSFDNRLLDRLPSTLRQLGIDQIVVTGDLTQLGLAGEYRQARQWLARLEEVAPLLLLPGNHDLYAPSSWRHFQELFPDPFPVEVALGEVVLFGLNSARPFPFPLAAGEIDREQLSRLEEGLRRTRGRFRIVALHHPPDPRALSSRKALLNGSELLALFEREPPELVIFGHSHRWCLSWLNGKVPALSLPPPHSRREAPDRAPCFHLYWIEGGKLSVELYRPGGAGFQPAERLRFQSQASTQRSAVGRGAASQAGRP